MKIKSKFFKIIKNKRGVLSELAPVPDLSQSPAAAGGRGGGEEIIAARETETIKEPEPQVKQLTSAGEVELIRLIRKALVLEPTEGTIPSTILDDEINEDNGREKLMAMKHFINTYSDDPDLDY